MLDNQTLIKAFRQAAQQGKVNRHGAVISRHLAEQIYYNEAHVRRILKVAAAQGVVIKVDSRRGWKLTDGALWG